MKVRVGRKKNIVLINYYDQLHSLCPERKIQTVINTGDNSRYNLVLVFKYFKERYTEKFRYV